MNFFHLKYFSTVAETKNFTRAARILRVSQPALSQQIQGLETDLKTRLFDRTNKGVVLTNSGKLVYEHCQRIFSAVNLLKDSVNDLNEGISGELVIGTVNSIGIHVLPKYMKNYMEQYPGVKLSLKYKSSDEVLNMLNEDQLDAAIIATNQIYPNLQQITFMKNDLYLVSAPDHPFSQKSKISCQDLNGENLITFDRKTPTRKLIDAYLESQALEMNTLMESENIETIKTMVSIGMGLAFIPEQAIRLELKSGVLIRIPLSGTNLNRNICLLYKPNRYMTKAAERFVELFTQSSLDPLH